ncbi:MAG: hypothetical protein IJ529_00705 [Alphaproteobacteria bacterium]|nr:hypothetical protein [Alphaproteobacteria bacterium]MBQ9235290.1 hypothetical protein [Alphaproteobacteria bacterium]
MKKFLLCLGIFLWSISAQAQDNMLQTEVEEQYFQEHNQSPDKSVIYIFFNNKPCPTCAQAVAMVEEAYNRNFLNQYSLFMINYAEDENAGFIQTYDLSQPLEVVMVDIVDGQEQGYRKMEGIEFMTSDPQAFNSYFVDQVNGYLGT